MAEFVEVMSQYWRLCRHTSCDECPLFAISGCSIYLRDHPVEAEEIIMKWAHEQPEERYPTWKEWLDSNFPNAGRICPCVFDRTLYNTCDKNCLTCTEHPIPDHLAKAFNLTPLKVCSFLIHKSNGDFCLGTKEIDPCSCGGDKNKCTHYPKKTEESHE